jgi:type IV fimbrial biogenesis protein FimT
MKAKSLGLTLVELLVVMVIIGLLTVLAVPSFKGLMAKRAVQAAASDVASDLRLARSEALKRSSFVTVCRSLDAATCAASQGSWHTGWIIYLDRNGNGSMDPGDNVLRVHQELSGIRSLGASNLATTKAALRFGPNGLGIGVSDSWNVTPQASALASATRLLCLTNQGRLTLRDAGAASC